MTVVGRVKPPARPQPPRSRRNSFAPALLPALCRHGVNCPSPDLFFQRTGFGKLTRGRTRLAPKLFRYSWVLSRRKRQRPDNPTYAAAPRRYCRATTGTRHDNLPVLRANTGISSAITHSMAVKPAVPIIIALARPALAAWQPASHLSLAPAPQPTPVVFTNAPASE